jgi:hypothetical protein
MRASACPTCPAPYSDSAERPARQQRFRQRPRRSQQLLDFPLRRAAAHDPVFHGQGCDSADQHRGTRARSIARRAQQCAIGASVAFHPQLHHAAAALRQLGAEHYALQTHRRCRALQQRARAVERLPLELTAADRTFNVPITDQHAHAGFARRRAEHFGNHDAHNDRLALQRRQQRARPIAQWREPLRLPRRRRNSRTLRCRQAHATAPPRMRLIARATDSGVAGASSSGSAPAGPQLAMASRIACNTEIASISGGSPTALER